MTYKNTPNNLCAFNLSILYTVFAPTLAIKLVMGTNNIKAGIFTKPILNGRLTSK